MKETVDPRTIVLLRLLGELALRASQSNSLRGWRKWRAIARFWIAAVKYETIIAGLRREDAAAAKRIRNVERDVFGEDDPIPPAKARWRS